MERKEWTPQSTVKECRLQGEGGQARRAFLGEEKGSIRGCEWTQKLYRIICRVLVSLQVWPNLKREKRWGDEEPAHNIKERNDSE